EAPALSKPAAPDEPGRYTRTQDQIVRIGSSVTVPWNQKVTGDVVAVGGSAHVKGYVQGDVVVIGGAINAGSGSRIDGDAVSIGGGVNREDGAIIGGQIVEVLPGMRWTRGRLTAEFLPYEGGWKEFIVNVLAWSLLSLLAVLLFRQRLEVMAAALPVHPGRTAVYGIAAFVLSPAAVATMVVAAAIVTVILAITVIGILLIPAVGAAVLAAMCGLAILLFLGSAAVWLSLGKAAAAQVGRADIRSLWAVLLGVLLVALASAIPVIGHLAIITLLIFGFGVAVMTGLGADAEWMHRRLGLRRGQTAGAPALAPAPEVTDEAQTAEAPGTQQPGEEEQESETPPSD
ncbi:MAG: hypothetical protein OEW93_10790, partial [Candidatus Bathyarchaeota archaeon]|nr:hypothetical protein [Candidatus Bathyarchaeota archaeon]